MFRCTTSVGVEIPTTRRCDQWGKPPLEVGFNGAVFGHGE
jgi:hypothetical protein